jgi:hypothetical protein
MVVKRLMLLTAVLLTMVILAATAYADVRSSGPGPFRGNNTQPVAQ